MDQSRAWQRHDHRRGGLFFATRKDRGGAWFVMILDEPNQSILVRRIGQQMSSHTFGTFVQQPVVEPFVVAEVKAQLLQLPLEVPIRFRDEDKIRKLFLDRWNYSAPVFTRRPLPGPASPGFCKYFVQEKHRHVAADAIGLLRDIG